MNKEQLIVELAHLIIGDLFPYSEDKTRLVDIQKQRESLWTNLAHNNPDYMTEILKLRDTISKGSIILESISRYPHEEVKLLRSFFYGPYHLKDQISEHVISLIALENASKDFSIDYVTYLKKILNNLGYADGLLDQEIRNLSISVLLDKLLEKI